MSSKWNRLLAPLLAALLLPSVFGPRSGADEVDRQVSLSASRRCMATDRVESKVRFSEGELAKAVRYVEGHPDFTAYHLLFSLGEYHPGEYAKISPQTRAAVLASAMVNLPMNDFGILGPKESLDFEAAQAFLELGTDGLSQLLPILDNKSRAPCFGSEIATTSWVRKYRRCDYAYRYAMLLLGDKPEFHRDIAARDKDIAALKRRLEKLGIKPPAKPAKWEEVVADAPPSHQGAPSAR